MSLSPTIDAPAAVPFVCACDNDMRPACKDLDFFRVYENKSYCVLHYPGQDKSERFGQVLKEKLAAQNFNFQGVRFVGDVDFSNVQFTEADFDHAIFPGLADFTSATFTGKAIFEYAAFSRADFKSATFGGTTSFRSASFSVLALFQFATFAKETSFRYALFATAALPERSTSPVAHFTSTTFEADVDFEHAEFGTIAYFTKAKFNGAASFNSVTFDGAAYFPSATFNAAADFDSVRFGAAALFDSATFKDYARFAGSDGDPVFVDTSSLSLRFANIEKPERFLFHTLKLRPHWFVNVDARSFDLTNVVWDWRHIDIRSEIKGIGGEDVLSAHRLLAVTCRDLADNAEANHRYEEASKFRYMAMDAWRLERWRGFTFWRLGWWYWLASGYGERILRALAVFLIIWLSFAALYSLPEPVRCPDGVRSPDCIGWDTTEKTRGFFDSFSNSAAYAIEAMTLQKPEPRPATPPARLAVLLCTILGPVQAALLALAIRRKFMR